MVGKRELSVVSLGRLKMVLASSVMVIFYMFLCSIYQRQIFLMDVINKLDNTHILIQSTASTMSHYAITPQQANTHPSNHTFMHIIAKSCAEIITQQQHLTSDIALDYIQRPHHQLNTHYTPTTTPNHLYSHQLQGNSTQSEDQELSSEVKDVLDQSQNSKADMSFSLKEYLAVDKREGQGKEELMSEGPSGISSKREEECVWPQSMGEKRIKKVVFDEIIMVKVFRKNDSPLSMRQNMIYYEGINYSPPRPLIQNTSSHPSQGHPAARQENCQNTNQNIYQLIYKDSINVLTFGRCYMKMRSKEVGEGELFAWCFPGFDFCLEIYLATVLRCLYVPPLPRIFLEVMLTHSFMASTFHLDSEFNLIHQQALIAILLYSWPLLASLQGFMFYCMSYRTSLRTFLAFFKYKHSV